MPWQQGLIIRHITYVKHSIHFSVLMFIITEIYNFFIIYGIWLVLKMDKCTITYYNTWLTVRYLLYQNNIRNLKVCETEIYFSMLPESFVVCQK
jgi:hypothetical protein